MDKTGLDYNWAEFAKFSMKVRWQRRREGRARILKTQIAQNTAFQRTETEDQLIPTGVGAKTGSFWHMQGSFFLRFDATVIEKWTGLRGVRRHGVFGRF